MTTTALPMINVANAATVKVGETKSQPCQACPWRIANWGRDDTAHPEYNTEELREQVWNERPGIRLANTMLCHCGGSSAKQCAGVTVLQHREVLRFQEHGSKVLSPENPHGLTFASMMVIAARMFGGPLQVPVSAIKRRVLLAAAHPAVADAGIGHHQVPLPAPGEFDA